MTSSPASEPHAPEAAPDTHLAPGAERDAALAVLGLLAYSQLTAFSRLAADAALAPGLDQRLELSRLAGLALSRLDRITDRVGEVDAQLQPVMGPFAGVLVEFDERTAPSTWWERLLKGYVGYGVADDFCRTIAGSLDARTRELVVAALADDGHAALVVGALTDAAAADPTLASRLALWGRRLVGEALGVVQRVITDHPDLRELLDRAMADAPGSGDAQQRLFACLTAEHSRRMERLGLTP